MIDIYQKLCYGWRGSEIIQLLLKREGGEVASMRGIEDDGNCIEKNGFGSITQVVWLFTCIHMQESLEILHQDSLFHYLSEKQLCMHISL